MTTTSEIKYAENGDRFKPLVEVLLSDVGQYLVYALSTQRSSPVNGPFVLIGQLACALKFPQIEIRPEHTCFEQF
jgi:hypothetical protein